MLTKIKTFITGMPWWAWVAMGICLLLIINQVSGSIYSRRLWNMVKDQIVSEDREIAENLKKENGKLLQDKYSLQKQNAKIEKILDTLRKENQRLEAERNEIQNQLDAIAPSLPPSTDLDGLAERFKRRGYRPIVLPRK